VFTSPSRWRAAVLAPIVLVLLAAACVNPLPPIVGPGEPLTGPNPEVPTTPATHTSVINYGPWTVPGATGSGHEGAGMIESSLLFGAPRPCGDCYITTFKPQLKYTDGTVANTDTGLWLHHFQIYVLGRTDPSCAAPSPYNLLGEHIFGGGNERTRARFPAGAGVKVGALDTWNLIYDLMNTGPTAKPVYLEMTYEWVPASTPNMHAARALYLDVSPVCVESRVPGGPGAFTRRRTFTAPLSGRVLGLAGHLHDGGRRLTLKNATTGQVICDATAAYGGPGFEEPVTEPTDHGVHRDPVVHLSSVGQCISPTIDRPLAVIGRGQQLDMEAFYENPTEAGHEHEGGHGIDIDEPVMGVFFMYILQE
jgi:hypothetical protein